ncbi:MAG: late competence development ComFB family protein [Thiotrichales bacterium]|nr:late competence development ComFB family protein [Thiotrichales bacterium]
MLDSVHNYFERLVFNHLKEHYLHQVSEDHLADLACLALNQLPPKYIRYDIDMSFFLNSEQRLQIEQQVTQACATAYQKLT